VASHRPPAVEQGEESAAAFACIHSVDSVELLQKLDAAAARAGRIPEVLVQLDLAGEDTKFGAGADEARRSSMPRSGDGVRAAGLMLIPPWNEDQEQTSPGSCRLRDLRDRWLAEGIPPRAAAPLDGHEPRFRGGDRGRRHHGAGRHGDFRET
jgi:uncharacterized pyridoxal phosphate-containing UPF0001 family protein